MSAARPTPTMLRALRRTFSATSASTSASAGAVVMGTGIMSIALSLAGFETVSSVLFGIDAFEWVAITMLLSMRDARDRRHRQLDLHSPAVLTVVADTAVVGARLALFGWQAAGTAFLAGATILWLWLMPQTLAAVRAPTTGGSFMLTVAPESLALLAAALARGLRTVYLLDAAMIGLVVGIVLYGPIVRRFEPAALLRGHGEHWIVGGAVAICAATCAEIVRTAGALDRYGPLVGDLETLSLALWALGALWLAVLVGAELRSPRLHYDVRRWATVFPVGMYAVCSFLVGAATHTSAITEFARVWVWIAFALWLVVLPAMLRVGTRRALS